jgi:hypothetical protein
MVTVQVPMLRERLLQGKDWPAVAKQQKKAQFGAAAKQLAQERLKGMLESFEMMCQIEQQQQQQQGKQHAAGNAGSGGSSSLLDGAGADEAAVLAAPIRVVCSRQVRSRLLQHTMIARVGPGCAQLQMTAICWQLQDAQAALMLKARTLVVNNAD